MLSPKSINNTPKWRNIRYEQISDGFVSTTSSNIALFCRTLASFGPCPPTATSSSSQQHQQEVWCRFRFGLTPTVAVASSKLYGEGAIIGVEISSGSSSSLLHAMLRCDGTLVVKRATSSETSSSSWNFKTNPLPQPTVTVLKGGGGDSSGASTILVAGGSVQQPEATTSNNNSNINDDEEFQLFRCPPCCIFTPGSTVLVRSSFSFSTCIVIEWIIFCSSSADLVLSGGGGGGGGGGNSSSSSSNLAVLVTQIIPISLSSLSSSCVVVESSFQIDPIAGQSANLCLPGSRKPDMVQMMKQQRRGGNASADDSTSSPTAEFVADFVAINSRSLIQRAPSLLLSGASFSGNITNGGSGDSTTSEPASLNSSVSNVTATTTATPTSPMRASTATTTTAYSESSATTADSSMMMRLATTGSKQLLKFSSHPSYVNLRAEASMKRMEALVDSI